MDAKQLAKLHLETTLRDGDSLLVVVRHKSLGCRRYLVTLYADAETPLTESVAQLLGLRLVDGAIELVNYGPQDLVEELESELGVAIEGIIA